MIRRSPLEFSDGAAGPLLAAEEAAELDWQDAALCAQADPEAWFPPKGGSTRRAKKICRACPSRVPCLTFALDTEQEWGIWGGASPEERRDMLAPRREERQADLLELWAALDGRARKRWPDGLKRCPHCRTEKPLDGFEYSSRSPNGLGSWCKACRTAARSNQEEDAALDRAA
jgi:WhiB family redox-sensing transcriptional regulator